MPDMTTDLTIWVDEDATTLSDLRSRATRWATEHDVPHVDDFTFLVDELAANAIQHGGSEPFAVRLCADEADVYAAVEDQSPSPPVLRQDVALEESGRGLQLVQLLSSDWGWAPLEHGKRVWFRMGR